MKETTDNVTELVEEIEKLFDDGEKIDGRKRKEREEWRNQINPLIERVNKLKGMKVYAKC